jgi:plastocyanin
MKRTILALAVVGLLSLAATSASAGSNAMVTIRHQTHGCHAWSVNGSAYKTSQSLKLAPGSTVTFVNNDVMAHKLTQIAGPRVVIRKMSSTMMDMSHEFTGAGVMAHMGASVKITFSKAGVYRFTTEVGEDYPSMESMKTIGEDNVLALKVVVS